MRRLDPRRRLPALIATAALLLAPAPGAFAEESPREAALRSFQRFARKWVGDLENPLRRYRDLRVEVRPTGDRRVPFVGVMQYLEESLACRSAGQCRVVSQAPITELFPFQGGRWRY